MKSTTAKWTSGISDRRSSLSKLHWGTNEAVFDWPCYFHDETCSPHIFPPFLSDLSKSMSVDGVHAQAPAPVRSPQLRRFLLQLFRMFFDRDNFQG